MPDLKQILAGSVKDVAQALDPLTVDELTELKALEEAGEKRKGVLSAIDTAIAAAVAANASETTDGVVDPRGDDTATIEPSTEMGRAIDMAHFAVDTDLRAGTSVEQNRIDFNDPRIDGREVVEAALAARAEG